MAVNFYSCRCFLTRNIFIKKLKKHFTYENEEQFQKDYKEVLDDLGTDEEKQQLLLEIQSEIMKRKALDEESMTHKRAIMESYSPLNSDIFSLNNDYFHPQFQCIVESAMKVHDRNEILSLMEVVSEEKQIYVFPFLKEEICQQLVAEFENFEKSPLPKGRPNSMNQHGILLDELGFYEKFINPLRESFVNPIAKVLFPEWCSGEFDSHHAFIVSYKMGQDVHLDSHFDNAEVTLNACLGKSFTGGELYFGNMKNEEESTYTMVPHKIGYAVLHRGQQVHGTLPILSGERYNLIMWMRSSGIRNKQCPMCSMKPDLVQAHGYGGGFTLPSDRTTEVCVVA